MKPETKGRLGKLLAEVSDLFTDDERYMAFTKLAEAQRLVADEPEPNDPPAPTGPFRWNVIGQVFFANGFDLEVEQDSEDEAREAAESLVRCGKYQLEAELQEVCIQSVTRVA